MTPEGRVKKMVKKALDTLGGDCWRFMPVQTGFGSPALDFLLSIRGRFVAIETKAPGKKLTPLQEGTKAAIEKAGGIVLIVWDEGSLAIAMKIILALEFSPSGNNSISDCLPEVFSPAQRENGGIVAYHTSEKEAWRDLEHEGAVEPAQAADATACGHHGAPGTPPDRHPEPEARRHDQRVTATVNDNSGLAASHRPLFPNGNGWE